MRSSWPHWALPAARQDWCLSSLQTTAQSALDGLKWWRPHNPPKQSEISSWIWLDSLPLKICCSLLSGPQSSLSLIWHYSHAIISYYCILLPQLLFCRPSNPIFPSEVKGLWSFPPLLYEFPPTVFPWIAVPKLDTVFQLKSFQHWDILHVLFSYPSKTLVFSKKKKKKPWH